jgi:predicted RNA-binding Zn-ribbon protein involved in translation (DUF1610 family)
MSSHMLRSMEAQRKSEQDLVDFKCPTCGEPQKSWWALSLHRCHMSVLQGNNGGVDDEEAMETNGGVDDEEAMETNVDTSILNESEDLGVQADCNSEVSSGNTPHCKNDSMRMNQKVY